MKTVLCFVAITLMFVSRAAAGPFAPFFDPTTYVVPSQITRWGQAIVDYSPTAGVTPAFANSLLSLGPADGASVSLGDLDAGQISQGIMPGAITIELRGRAFDGPGADLAIFENAFAFPLDFGNPDPTDPFVFGELAFVEVSSNGSDFARFPATSLNIEPDGNGMLDPNELNAPFGRDFAGLDTTNVDNLAGVHPSGFGTAFDLADLAGNPLVTGGAVDLSAIRYVRLVDIPGNGALLDALGNPIVDTWLTTGSGGLDLDAVGAIHSVPEPATAWLLAMMLLAYRTRAQRP